MQTAMTMPAPISGDAGHAAVPRIVVVVCVALCVMNALSLVGSAITGQWILDPQGLGIPTDFTNVYAAGRLVLDGHPATAYYWDVHKLVQETVLGRTFTDFFGWHYPPPFLFVAALLAKFPYSVAFAGWAAISSALYLVTIRALTNHRIGWLLACAFPVVLFNALIGQNGCLTAALIGGTLYLLPTRPWLAGVCLGLLTYKPQYGLMFPLALIAARQWKTFASAALTGASVTVLSLLAFGSETWTEFFHWLPRASTAFLSDGAASFGKMQSVLSLTRFLGGGDTLARSLQWGMTGMVALTIVILWRCRISYEIKAAALATGALLATPYLYLYDMMVLAIPVALIVRMGIADGFRSYELPALGVVTVLLMVFPYVVMPTGLAAALIVAALIARRAGLQWGDDRNSVSRP